MGDKKIILNISERVAKIMAESRFGQAVSWDIHYIDTNDNQRKQTVFAGSKKEAVEKFKEYVKDRQHSFKRITGVK